MRSFILALFFMLSIGYLHSETVIIIPRDHYNYNLYQPDNGPMRGPNSLEAYKHEQFYYPTDRNYYNYNFYQPDNGPMRGPNSLDAYKYHLYNK